MSEKISSQILKGVLQGILLMLIDKEPSYGYAIMKRLADYGLEAIPKGTIYPLLTNMTTKGLLSYEVKSVADSNRQRKYYFLTPAGNVEKEIFIKDWQTISMSVQLIFKEMNNE